MIVIAGCNRRITAAFEERDAFWLNIVPPENLKVDGFKVQPGSPSGRHAVGTDRAGEADPRPRSIRDCPATTGRFCMSAEKSSPL